MKKGKFFRLLLIFLQIFLFGLLFNSLMVKENLANLGTIVLSLPELTVSLFSIIFAIFLFRHYRTGEAAESQFLSLILASVNLKLLSDTYGLLYLTTPLFIKIFAFAGLFEMLLFIGLGLYQDNTSYVTSGAYCLSAFLVSIILVISMNITSQADMLFYLAEKKNITGYSILLATLFIIALIVFINSRMQDSSAGNTFKQIAYIFLIVGNTMTFYNSQLTYCLVGAGLFAAGVITAMLQIRRSTVWN